jgi:hypothetical protein
MSDRRVRVVYIAGASRSGSTLLAMLLGTIPGCVSVGEVRHLWRRGVEHDQLCGCGERFSSCPFWSEVGDRAFGGWDLARSRRMLALQSRVDRFRRLPALALLRVASRRRALVDEYLEATSRIYDAAAEVAGSSTVIDSSKSASFALLLGRMQGVDASILHLVRDSRAVAHSWTRRRAMPEVTDREEYMATFGPFKAAAMWAGSNGALDVIDRTSSVPSVRLRYEEMVRGSSAQLRALAGALGIDEAAVSSLAGPEVPLTVQHTVAGNPARFARGGVVLRPDDEWRHTMRSRDRRAVEMLTWPLLARYGYHLRS